MDDSPSALDLALCVVILQTQPEELSGSEYISLLRSSVTPLNTGESRQTLQRLDRLELSHKFLDTARKETTKLRARVLELEQENCSLRNDLEKSKGQPSTKPIIPNTNAKACGKKRKSSEVIAQKVQGLGDLEIWKKPIIFSLSIPHLINNLKCLLLAGSPQTLSIAIQGTCSTLRQIIQSYCEIRQAEDTICSPPLKKNRPNSKSPAAALEIINGQDLVKTLYVALDLTVRKISSSLDRLREQNELASKSVQPFVPDQDNMKKSDERLSPSLANSAYSFANLLGELMHLIYLNSCSLIRWKLALKENEIPRNSVVDLRDVFSRTITGVLKTLRPEFKHDRQILDAILLSNLNLLGAALAAEQCPHSSEQGSDQELILWSFEESSWFWIEILRKSLETYRLHLKWLRSKQELDSTTPINLRQDFLLASSARDRLLEGLYRGTFGYYGVGNLGKACDNTLQRYPQGGNLRFNDTVLMSELWELLSVDAFMSCINEAG